MMLVIVTLMIMFAIGAAVITAEEIARDANETKGFWWLTGLLVILLVAGFVK